MLNLTMQNQESEIKKACVWHRTTTGYVMTINGKKSYFVREVKCDCNSWEIYKVVQGDNGCLLVDFADSLNEAKSIAYNIEMQ